MIANDNQPTLLPSIDRATPGQALTISQTHRRFGETYAEFVGHAGNGRDILVSKLISSMWKSRWTKPMRVPRSSVLKVHCAMAKQVSA